MVLVAMETYLIYFLRYPTDKIFFMALRNQLYTYYNVYMQRL